MPISYLGGTAAAGSVEWVQLTQAMVDAGTKYTGSADTLKSAVVSGGVLTVTSNVIAGTADGIRETSGIGIPILSILPDLDPDLHNVAVYCHDVQTSSVTMAMALALCTAPGASAVGVGMLVTDAARAHAQSQTATVAASSYTGPAALGMFFLSGDSATATVESHVDRVLTDGSRHHQGVSTVAVDLTNLANVYLYVQAASYSGAQIDNSTAAAEVYVGLVPKLSDPTA